MAGRCATGRQRPPADHKRGALGFACTSDQSEQRVVWRGCHHAALAVCAGRRHRHRLGRPPHRRRNARDPRPRVDPCRRRRRHRDSHGQRPTRLRDRPDCPGARRLGGVRRHSRHAVSRTKHASTARAHAVVRGDGDLVWQNVVADCMAGHPLPLYEGGRVSGDAVRLRRAGICCPRAATCGRRCRPCADARSIARSVRSGAPTDRSRASAASIASSRKSSSCAGWASGSSRSPTTTSTP